MIEYLHPGVYLAEVEFKATPIDGVPTTQPGAAPAWTTPDPHDPGVTLLELFGFLAEPLLYRADLAAIGAAQGLSVQPTAEGTALQVAPGLALDPAGRALAPGLPAVSSPYIGETEKNLGAVFGDAPSNRALLRYDETDALFGKRN